MSQLERLPTAVRKKILQQLLKADNVRQPPNHYMVENYKFETGILRVNKAIHEEGVEVLYGENTFVKVRWEHHDGETSMTNHEIPFFKVTKKMKFSHQVVDISVTPTSSDFRDTKCNRQNLIMLAQDLPKLARLLQILDVANMADFSFKFEFHKRPGDTNLYSELLLPFEILRGVRTVQTVSITGPVDPVIAARVTKAMTQKVSWLRAEAWRMYELMLSIKRVGDLAFKLGNADITLAKYDDAEYFRNTVIQNSKNRFHEMMLVADDEWHLTTAHFEAVRYTDLALLMLSDIVSNEISRQYKAVPRYNEMLQAMGIIGDNVKRRQRVPKEVLARFHHLLGIAELGLNHPVKAGKAFNSAHGMAYRGAREGWQTAKDWKGLSTTDQQARLDILLAAMPKTPLDAPDIPSYMTPEVEPEKYVMRQLGFDGEFPYPDQVKGCWAVCMTNKPHPNQLRPGPRTARIGQVMPEKLEPQITKYRKRMNAAPGLICRVGLRQDECGDESVLDDPAHAAMLREMSASLRRDMRLR